METCELIRLLSVYALPFLGMTFIFIVHDDCESYSHIKIPRSQMEEVTKKDAAPLCLLIQNLVNLAKYP